jgi:hypothetical protein
MTPKHSSHLPPCVRAVYAILRTCPCTAPQLAYLLAGRFKRRTVDAAVERLRLTGKLRRVGRYRRAETWTTRLTTPTLRKEVDDETGNA